MWTTSDKAQAWKMAWTAFAVAVLACGGIVTEDTTTIAALAGVSATIIGAVWVRRPGDNSGQP